MNIKCCIQYGRNITVSPHDNLPTAHEAEDNEPRQIKNCNPSANGCGIFVLLHYGDLMQAEGLSNHFL